MRKKGLLGVFVVVLALCAALVGCGGTDGGSAADATKNFAATWEISSMTSDGKETSGDDIELIKSLGMSVYLTLAEDGKATLEIFGVTIDGTWEAKDATTATLKFEGDEAGEAGLADEQEVKIVDGELGLESASSSMTFEQIDPANKVTGSLGSLLESVDVSDIESTLENVEREIGSSASDITSSLAEVSELDITIADDDICTIRVTAKGDYYGDPGYVLNVTNNGDATITVADDDEYDVDGKAASPVFSLEVKPDETKTEILWFESSELGDGGVDALNNVTGGIVVSSATSPELAIYDFVA